MQPPVEAGDKPQTAPWKRFREELHERFRSTSENYSEVFWRQYDALPASEQKREFAPLWPREKAGDAERKKAEETLAYYEERLARGQGISIQFPKTATRAIESYYNAFSALDERYLRGTWGLEYLPVRREDNGGTVTIRLDPAQAQESDAQASKRVRAAVERNANNTDYARPAVESVRRQYGEEAATRFERDIVPLMERKDEDGQAAVRWSGEQKAQFLRTLAAMAYFLPGGDERLRFFSLNMEKRGQPGGLEEHSLVSKITTADWPVAMDRMRTALRAACGEWGLNDADLDLAGRNTEALKRMRDNLDNAALFAEPGGGAFSEMRLNTVAAEGLLPFYNATLTAFMENTGDARVFESLVRKAAAIDDGLMQNAAEGKNGRERTQNMVRAVRKFYGLVLPAFAYAPSYHGALNNLFDTDLPLYLSTLRAQGKRLADLTYEDLAKALSADNLVVRLGRDNLYETPDGFLIKRLPYERLVFTANVQVQVPDFTVIPSADVVTGRRLGPRTYQSADLEAPAGEYSYISRLTMTVDPATGRLTITDESGREVPLESHWERTNGRLDGSLDEPALVGVDAGGKPLFEMNRTGKRESGMSGAAASVVEMPAEVHKILRQLSGYAASQSAKTTTPSSETSTSTTNANFVGEISGGGSPLSSQAGDADLLAQWQGRGYGTTVRDAQGNETITGQSANFIQLAGSNWKDWNLNSGRLWAVLNRSDEFSSPNVTTDSGRSREDTQVGGRWQTGENRKYGAFSVYSTYNTKETGKGTDPITGDGRVEKVQESRETYAGADALFNPNMGGLGTPARLGELVFRRAGAGFRDLSQAPLATTGRLGKDAQGNDILVTTPLPAGPDQIGVRSMLDAEWGASGYGLIGGNWSQDRKGYGGYDHPNWMANFPAIVMLEPHYYDTWFLQHYGPLARGVGYSVGFFGVDSKAEQHSDRALELLVGSRQAEGGLTVIDNRDLKTNAPKDVAAIGYYSGPLNQGRINVTGSYDNTWGSGFNVRMENQRALGVERATVQLAGYQSTMDRRAGGRFTTSSGGVLSYRDVVRPDLLGGTPREKPEGLDAWKLYFDGHLGANERLQAQLVKHPNWKRAAMNFNFSNGRVIGFSYDERDNAPDAWTRQPDITRTVMGGADVRLKIAPWLTFSGAGGSVIGTTLDRGYLDRLPPGLAPAAGGAQLVARQGRFGAELVFPRPFGLDGALTARGGGWVSSLQPDVWRGEAGFYYRPGPLSEWQFTHTNELYAGRAAGRTGIALVGEGREGWPGFSLSLSDTRTFGNDASLFKFEVSKMFTFGDPDIEAKVYGLHHNAIYPTISARRDEAGINFRIASIGPGNLWGAAGVQNWQVAGGQSTTRTTYGVIGVHYSASFNLGY